MLEAYLNAMCWILLWEVLLTPILVVLILFIIRKSK